MSRDAETRTVYEFGRTITELDLSDHKDPAEPCTGLAISGVLSIAPRESDSGRYEFGGKGMVFLYR
ncbi:MAG TPA: hypothetical protein VFE19_03675 [Jatrophihabitantaceae bacterium]|jgi:hypothetical protein|nr:hypothetical protein [Jatrophihabitantaceae bacterium]